jgi:protein TonB
MSPSPSTPSFSASLPNALRRTAGLLGVCVALLLVACAAPKPPAPDASLRDLPPVVEVPIAAPSLPPPTLVSEAITPRDYRQDGARHIYGKNAHRIFKGKLPPLLQGVGTMQLQLDLRGQIVAMDWMRPPSHPMAKSEIERAVREAAPYPAPVRMGGVVYTDTWLWDKSGHFQLDTLTEGQRDR